MLIKLYKRLSAAGWVFSCVLVSDGVSFADCGIPPSLDGISGRSLAREDRGGCEQSVPKRRPHLLQTRPVTEDDLCFPIKVVFTFKIRERAN